MVAPVKGGKGISEDIPEVRCIYVETFSFSLLFIACSIQVHGSPLLERNICLG